MKILVVDLLAIGDLLMATGAIHLLRTNFPNAEISVLALNSSVIVLKGNTDIDHIIEAPTDHFFKRLKIFSAVQDVLLWRKVNYDLIVSFHVGKEPNLIVRLLRTTVKVIPGHNCLYDIVASDRKSYKRGLNLYIEVLPKVVRQAISLYRDEIVEVPLRPIINILRKDDTIELLQKYGLRSRQYIALFPGGGVSHDTKDYTRRYPYYDKVVDLINSDIPIVLIGSNTDKEPCAKIISSTHTNKRIVDLHGKTNFNEFVGVIAHSAMILTNDSSALHVAFALDHPVVAIFGPTVPNEKVFPGDNSMILSPQNQSIAYSGRYDGRLQDALEMFDQIKPEDVASKVNQLILNVKR